MVRIYHKQPIQKYSLKTIYSFDFISYCKFMRIDNSSIEILKNNPAKQKEILSRYRNCFKKISLKQFILENL